MGKIITAALLVAGMAMQTAWAAEEAVAVDAAEGEVDASEPAPEATTGDAANEPTEAPAEEDMPPPTGDLRDNLRRNIPVFIPSEAIDVDKPVDFPTNI